MSSPSNGISRMLVAVFRHKKKVLLIGVSLVVLTIAGLVFWPRTYESEAKLLVRLGHESVSLDPTATTGQTVAFQRQHEEEINSVLEILNSREIVERVVDKLGPGEILAPSDDEGGESSGKEQLANAGSAVVNSAKTLLSDALTGIGLLDDISNRERAIRKLHSRLEATAARRSGVVSVTCRAPSPKSAQKIVATATQEFLDHHVGLTQTAGSHAFFEAETNSLHDQLEAATTNLSNRKNDFGIVSIEGARKLLLNEIGDVKLAALANDQSLAFSKSRIVELDQQMEQVPKEVVSGTTTVANSARDGMRQQLYELQQTEQELLSRMTEKHPRITAIRQQRTQMQKILEQSEPDREEPTSSPNPLRQTIEAELLRERANLAALEKRGSVLEDQLLALKGSVAELNSREVEVRDLERKVETLRSEYMIHVASLGQARVAKELEAKKISSINLAQPASFKESPVSPQKRIALAGGMLAAMLMSVGVAFWSERSDTTIRTPEQIQSWLNLPVIQRLPASVTGGGSGSQRVLAGRLNSAGETDLEETPVSSPTVGVINCGTSLSHSVAADLAVEASQIAGRPVLLVDADAKRRRVGSRFDVNGAEGLSEFLQGEMDIADCVQDSGHDDLSLLGSGAGGAATAIDLRQVPSRLKPLSESYGLIITELPAVQSQPSALRAAREFDAVLVVIEAERTKREDAEEICQKLTDSGANVLGCVLNGAKNHIPRFLRSLV